jgi:hypothetical protein
MKNAKYLLLCLCLGSFFFSCEEEISSIRLTSRERIRIDTISKQQIDSLIPVLDSLCNAQYGQMVQQALDSILETRKAEELKIRSRITQ